MENMVILNQEPIYSITNFQIILFISFVVLFVIGALFCFVGNKLAERITPFVMIGMFISFCLLAYTPKLVNYQYDVLINDSVNIKELYYQYNIISVKGNIYTIEPKLKNTGGKIK